MQAVAELSIPGVVVNATDLELFAARDSNTWGDRMMCVWLPTPQKAPLSLLRDMF